MTTPVGRLCQILIWIRKKGVERFNSPHKTTTPEQQKAATIKPTDQERFNKARKALREYWVNR